ncbi:hypothetical protein VTJ04DRAFT_5133 [Mycothermus thermophilus]|uniref:uncharacterized protein n=1 Tax=Humicola insolens TaxID=85995 RepID=UPI0037428F3C
MSGRNFFHYPNPSSRRSLGAGACQDPNRDVIYLSICMYSQHEVMTCHPQTMPPPTPCYAMPCKKSQPLFPSFCRVSCGFIKKRFALPFPARQKRKRNNLISVFIIIIVVSGSSQSLQTSDCRSNQASTEEKKSSARRREKRVRQSPCWPGWSFPLGVLVDVLSSVLSQNPRRRCSSQSIPPPQL